MAAQRIQAQRYCSQYADISVVDPLTASGGTEPRDGRRDGQSDSEHDGQRDASLQEYWTNGLGDVISAPVAPSAAWHPLSLHRSSRG